MTDGVWTCPICRNANRYPDDKSCLVCDYEIGKAEMQAAEKSLAQYVSEEKKQKLEMALAEMKRKQAEAAYKRIPFVSSSFERLDSVCDRFVDVFSEALKIFKICTLVLLLLGIAVVAFSVIQDAETDLVLAACDDILASKMEAFEAYHFIADRRGNYVFEPFYRIVDRINYISQQIKDSDSMDFFIQYFRRVITNGI